MSILENFVQLVLKFKGNKDDALMEVQSFVAQLFCSLFHIGKNQELLIFNQCLKRMDQVLMNLHNYFKGAQLPIEKIFNDKPFLQEGFVSSEDEIEKPQQKIKKRSETFNIKEPTLAVDEKVKLRDEVIQKMTIGYLKDVQHLREMFVRKDLFPNEEIFDVSYYDYTNNLDPIIKSFIYNKILDVTQQFRLQIQKLSQQNQKLLSEMDKLRQLVKKIVGSAEIESQIRAILSIDKDLYRFWRGVQDVIGTQQIFEIFEKRKMGYGIDYIVIDQCISNSQASGRIYAEYKSQLEEQQLKLTEQVGREIVQLRKQIESLSYQIQDHEEEKKTDFLQVKAQIKTGVESIYEIKQNTIRDQYRENLQDALDLISDKDAQLWIRRAIKGHALYKWIYMAKIKSLIKPHNIRRAQSRDKNYKSLNLFGLKDNRVQQLKQELRDKQNELLEAQMNLLELKGEHTLLKSKFTNVKYNFEMQVQRNVYMQQNLVQLENIVEYFSKIFKFIKTKLGFGYLDINLKNSQYYLDRADQHIKQFELRVQKLKLEDHDLLTELVEQQAKRQIMYRKMNQNNAVDSSIITDVYDVSKPLQDPENDLNQYMVLMGEQLKQTEIDNQQAEVEMQQAEEKFYQEQLKLEQQYSEEEDHEQFENDFLIKPVQSPIHQMKQSIVLRKNSVKDNKDMIMTQSIKQPQAKTEANDRLEKQRSIQQIKKKNQGQQTSVSIDCTKCFNNLMERMNPEFQSPFEYPEAKQVVQISKSKLFQAKQQTFGTLLTQYNVSRMQSARGRRVYEKSGLNQTMYTSASRQESNKDRCLTFKGERAQIIITPKSLPISNRHQKHNK